MTVASSRPRRPRGSLAPVLPPFVAVVVPIAFAIAGCGISIRYVVESDMRFEHCYRLDEDGRTPIDDKRQCWREWTATYQKGQDRSRVAYATERLRVLDSASTPNGGAASPSTTSASGASTTIVLASTGSGTAPLSPYAPPPATASSSEVSAVNDSPTWQACSETCSKTWKACAPSCNGQMPCVSTCEDHYRVCMKACF